MKKYQEPQAHHWIVLRLVGQLAEIKGSQDRDAVLSALWLMREVGYNRLMDMIEQLEQEKD